MLQLKIVAIILDEIRLRGDFLPSLALGFAIGGEPSFVIFDARLNSLAYSHARLLASHSLFASRLAVQGC